MSYRHEITSIKHSWFRSRRAEDEPQADLTFKQLCYEASLIQLKWRKSDSVDNAMAKKKGAPAKVKTD